MRIHGRLLPVLLLVLVLAAPAIAGNGSDVTLDAKDLPVGEALAPVRATADVEIVLAPEAAEAKVTVRLGAVPWPEALDRIARAAGLEVAWKEGKYTLSPTGRVTFDFTRVERRKLVGICAAHADANLVHGKLEGKADLACDGMHWREALDRALEGSDSVLVERGGILRIVPKDRKTPNTSALPEVDRRVSLDVTDQPLPKVLEYFSGLGGVNLVPGPGAAGQTVSLRVDRMPWLAALRLAADRAGCSLVPDGAFIHVVRPPQVSFDFQNTDVRKFFSVLGAYAGTNLVYGAEVKGRVTVRLRMVSWLTALDAVADVLGLAVVEDGGILWITTPELAAKAPVPVPLLAGVEGGLTLDLVDRPLEDLVAPFQRAAGIAITLDEAAAKAWITLRVENAPWRKVLELVERRAGCLASEAEANTIRLTAAPPVSFDFQDADVRKIVAVVGAYARVEIDCAPEVSGTLTLRLNRVPWPTALRCVARAIGLTVEEVGPKKYRLR